jgi:hypothetical protein
MLGTVLKYFDILKRGFPPIDVAAGSQVNPQALSTGTPTVLTIKEVLVTNIN